MTVCLSPFASFTISFALTSLAVESCQSDPNHWKSRRYQWLFSGPIAPPVFLCLLSKHQLLVAFCQQCHLFLHQYFFISTWPLSSMCAHPTNATTFLTLMRSNSKCGELKTLPLCPTLSWGSHCVSLGECLGWVAVAMCLHMQLQTHQKWFSPCAPFLNGHYQGFNGCIEDVLKSQSHDKSCM